MNRPSGLSLKRRSRIRLGLIAGAVLLLASAGYFTYSFLTQQPVKEVPAKPAVKPIVKKSIKNEEPTPVTPANFPSRITIPAARVNGATVEQLGVEANGDLAAPLTNAATGWYTKSVTPGSGKGAVLINGHVGISGQPGVFERLGQVKVGDTVTVNRVDGKRYVYKVYDTEQLPIAKVDMAKMMRSVDPSREGLNIITCSGKYEASQATYDQRLLVYAVQVE